MREKVATFGTCGSLLGIVSEPANVDVKKTAVIVLNSGLVHRCGPFQVATRLSRDFSVDGFLSLRFDSSGIGDSPHSAGEYDYTGQLIQDVGHAITYLERSYGVRQVVLFGICTGADNAHKATLVYPQVVGAVFVDGYAYKTAQFYLRRYAPILKDAIRIGRAMKNLCFSLVKKLRAIGVKRDLGEVDRGYFTWKLPPKISTTNDLNVMVNRGVELLYFFTAGSHRYCNYEGQLQDSLSEVDFRQQLTVCFAPKIDHTFILSEDQQFLFSEVKHWLNNKFE